MSTKLEIPADVIPDVRDALLFLLGHAAEDVASEVARQDCSLHPEWLAPGRDQFEHACELLDLIGWDGTLRPQRTEVDIDEHGRTLRDALEHTLPLLETELEEVAVNDTRRAQRGEPPQREPVTNRVLALREFTSAVQRRARR